jgi:hypothetical protein
VSSSALSANELAKEISNPVTSIWQLQFQFNNVKLESKDFSPVSGEWVNNLYFQPVMPVSLTEDWNLITRPVSHGDRRQRTDNDFWRYDPGDSAFARPHRAVDLWSRTYLDIPDRRLGFYRTR